MEAEEIALSDGPAGGLHLQHIKGDLADVVGGVRDGPAEFADGLIDPNVLDFGLCFNHDCDIPFWRNFA